MKTTVLIVIGILLGYFLGIMFFEFKGRSAPPQNEPQRIQNASRTDSAGAATSPQPAKRSGSWSLMESTNDLVYIEDLRRFHCPEQTITAIILGKLLRNHQPDQTPSSLKQVVGRQRRAEEQLAKLGLEPLERPQDHFFSREQLDKARKTMVLFSTATNKSQTISNNESRLAYLAPLTQDQTVYFKSEFEFFGRSLVRVLSGFRPTRNEFYAIILAMADADSDGLAQLLPTVLTPERYQELLGFQSPANQALYRFSERIPNGPRLLPQLRQILQERDTLSVQEYRNRLLALLGRDGFEIFTSECGKFWPVSSQ